ncbi:histone-like nucleoid-structuring protein Lsr2 [Curtobacterium flaccumfaciens pv. flaccumfaciens]
MGVVGGCVEDHAAAYCALRGGTTAKRGNSDELAKIREWANANGHEVSSRGRISQAVRDAYDAAH